MFCGQPSVHSHRMRLLISNAISSHFQNPLRIRFLSRSLRDQHERVSNGVLWTFRKPGLGVSEE